MTEPYSTGPEREPEPEPAPRPAADGLDANVAALLSYLIFMWIGGLIMFFTQRNREVRFHAAQSILASIALAVLWIVLMVVGTVLAFIPILGGLITVLVWAGLSLGGLALWIFLCIKGYNLEHFKLPVIGDIAERWAAS